MLNEPQEVNELTTLLQDNKIKSNNVEKTRN